MSKCVCGSTDVTKFETETVLRYQCNKCDSYWYEDKTVTIIPISDKKPTRKVRSNGHRD